MKKISLALFWSALLLFGTGTIVQAEESRTSTSSQSELSLAHSEELKAKTDTNQVYAKVITRDTLQPEDFKNSIEDIYDLTVTTISFSENQHANTMTPGIYKIEVLFKTSTGKIYNSKLPYLVENDHPTIFIDNIHYDYKKKKTSFKSSEKEADVYIKTNNKYYTCTTDNNGYFEGKYNPDTLPDSLQFIALDDLGNYSDEHVLFLSTDDKLKKLTIDPFIYQENNFQIQGIVSKNIDTQVELPSKKTTAILPGKDGAINFSYDKQPKTIELSLKKDNTKRTLSFEPMTRNPKTLNELKKSHNPLTAVRENRTKRTIIVLAIILVVGTGLLLIRSYLSARRQN